MKLKRLEDVEFLNDSKASFTRKLNEHRFTIPNSYAILCNECKEGTLDVSILDRSKRYAVRSTKIGEDSMESSFAGMFETFLNVSYDDVEDKIKEVYKSYKLQKGESSHQLVLVQEMVEALYAGVAFTRNPITDQKEVIIEYVEGLGTSLVQDGSKAQQVKYKWGQVLFDNDIEDISKRKVLKEVARYAMKAERVFGFPVDMEWAYDGSKVYWLQIRPITTESTLDIYDNSISKNYLPGLIKPLIYDVNVPLVNGAWIEILEEILGPVNVAPEDLAKSVYYRAYFNMGVLGSIFRQIGFREDFLEKLSGVHDERLDVKFKLTWKLVRNMGKALRFSARSRRKMKQLESILKVYHQESLLLDKELEETEDIKEIKLIFDKIHSQNSKGAYLKILIPLMNMAKQIKLNKIVQKENLVLGKSVFDDDLSQYEPSIYLDRFREKMTKEEVSNFLSRFGHFSDNNNDFSNPSWTENHDFLNLVEDKVEREVEVSTLTKKLQNLKRKADFGNYQAAQLTYYYNYSYMLFRKVFLKVGKQLVKKQYLQNEEDIFYVSLDNVLQFMNQDPIQTQVFIDEVNHHKNKLDECKDYILPSKIYGNEKPLLITSSDALKTFKGVPMSKGRFEGTIKVVKSLSEYEKLDKGDILVIPFSDMSFEPLLEKSSAVLIESGGILSHIGIQARERKIPAITSLEHITTLKDNSKVALDAYTGEVFVLD